MAGVLVIAAMFCLAGVALMAIFPKHGASGAPDEGPLEGFQQSVPFRRLGFWLAVVGAFMATGAVATILLG